jgi:hypothetical protein
MKNKGLQVSHKGPFKGWINRESKGPSNPEITPSFSFSASSSKQPPLPPEGEELFENFWKEYPNKIYQGETEKVWRNLEVLTPITFS